MEALLFLKSVLIGLSIAAPVGPIGLLCIQRTLGHGARIGFISGLGAAAADACYGALGAFGIGAITSVFVALASPLALAGALFLAWMGMKMLRATPPERAASASDPVQALPAFASVFLLTLSNPMTILSFVAIFATLSGGEALSGADGLVMVLGVFCGSALWWLALSLGVSMIRHRLGVSAIQWIDRTAGVFLLGFAAWQLVRVIAS
ncbi:MULTISPECIES: LysE family translocator [unclassified Pseudomonas]|uniref:LysE family translocator n=1 Tax=unclassified Pseudomonas TaxID=196821 RepID=UPI000EAA1484|nr:MULTISPECIES: LysE family transporter [unclassified Pseudomonas]AYF86422.1 LysE family translocator [Pseudomonas sp. DY-1]MRK23754.1 LysE family translocator [Pseudomonas sp. JG-B]